MYGKQLATTVMTHMDALLVGGLGVVALAAGGFLLDAQYAARAVNDADAGEKDELTPAQAEKQLGGGAKVRTMQASGLAEAVGYVGVVLGVAGVAYAGYRMFQTGAAGGKRYQRLPGQSEQYDRVLADLNRQMDAGSVTSGLRRRAVQ